MEFDILSFMVGVGIALCCFLVAWLWLAYFHVEEGHLAVLVRFGAVVLEGHKNASSSQSREAELTDSKPMQLYSPGGHWKFPWDKVIIFSTMERVIDLSGEEGGKYAMAADGTVLRLDSKIRFFPKSSSYYSYLFELKNPMGHIKEMFICVIRNEIANFKGSSTSTEEILGSYSEIRRERKLLNQQVEYICRSQIGSSYGIQFLGVDLIDIVPPQELESALNGIQNAKTEADTMYSKAEADTRQKVLAAEQGVEIAKVRAESVANELRILAKTIKGLMAEGNADHYLAHRRAELLGDSKLVFLQKGDI
ncbi:MAG: hypothetical protein RJB66_1010 [Pseudomonadota bacterium]|jgi:regulator of protease activity HflC (stomatin/prohibitin superfamily)